MTRQAMSLQAMSLQAISLRAGLVAAVLLGTPAAVLAAPGMINTSVNLRAGPSVEFPVVNRLPVGVPVEVHGCIRQELWCDVSWGRERGWVAAQYLDYLYDGRYVDLRSYVVDVPVASFVLTSYWSSYYFGRPWYRRHAWWNRHWNTQTHVASQTPAAQPAAAPAQAGRGMMPTGVATGRGVNAAPAVVGGQAAGARAMLPANGGMAPVAGGQNRLSAARPPMISRAAGQATAMRSGGVPMAARAQFGGSHGGLVGLPHAAMGGAPQAGGAMHSGGGGGSRDNGGRHRH